MIESKIEEFKKRIGVEPEFCRGLFHHATVRILACKYAYYIHNNPFIEDYAYDMDEKSWYAMGMALDLLKEEETSPCIDWSYEHPLARKAMKMAAKLMRRRSRCR